MKELNDNNFDKEIANSKLALVDFYATWCGPCGLQAEVLKNLKSSRSLKFDIIKVNVDEAPELALKYGVESIPTLMVFKGNELLKRMVGVTGEQEILDVMEEFED